MGSPEGLGRSVGHDAAPCARWDLERRELDEPREAPAGPGRTVEPTGAEPGHVVGDQRARAAHLDGGGIVTARQVELDFRGRVSLDGRGLRHGQALADEPPGHDHERALGKPAREAVVDLQRRARRQQHAAQLGREVVVEPPSREDPLGRLMELTNDDLGEGVGSVERHAIAHELGPLFVLDHAKRPRVAAPDA
jgi:hypothetical protein